MSIFFVFGCNFVFLKNFKKPRGGLFIAARRHMPFWPISGFLKRNRLTVRSRLPGDTHQFHPVFWVFMKGLAIGIDPPGNANHSSSILMNLA